MKTLDEQVAIVTGAARGIGLGIARVLAAEGATVVLADKDRSSAEAAASELRAVGADALAIELDVRSSAEVQEKLGAVARRSGRIDILAANAGVYPLAPLAAIDDAAWDLVMDINAKGALHCLQACAPWMATRSYGRVVLTASITGPITGHPGFSHYGASKAAMLGMMRSAALELAPSGVTVNAVLPGNIRTPGLNEMGEENERQMLASIPMAAFGAPADIGWAVRFLASPEAGYITGQTLVVDGGAYYI